MSAMRPLVIDDAARWEADRVLHYAEAHHYVPGPGAKPPGDEPNFVAHFNTYRAVFSYTRSHGTLWRHLSVSVPEDGMLPNPFAVWSLADLFGFIGWDQKSQDPPPDWMFSINDQEHCVVVGQVVQPAMVH